MSAFGALIIANLKRSGDPEMLELAAELEEYSIQCTVDEENRRLEGRPAWQKLQEGDGLEVLPAKTMRWLKEQGQDW